MLSRLKSIFILFGTLFYPLLTPVHFHHTLEVDPRYKYFNVSFILFRYVKRIKYK